MGLHEEIIEIFFSKLLDKEEVPKQVIEKLRELINSKEINEESLHSIFKVN